MIGNGEGLTENGIEVNNDVTRDEKIDTRDSSNRYIGKINKTLLGVGYLNK